MTNHAQAPDATIRVMLVDDHAPLRAVLRSVIDREPDLAVIAEADGGLAAIELLGHITPDVVLMDGSMPGLGGVETTRRLTQRQPDLKVIGLTLFGQQIYLEEMVAAGACGYVLKTGEAADIIDAIRVVAAGGRYFDKTVARESRATADRPAASGELSADELAVIKRLANGEANAEIAAALGLALSAVERHRAAAMDKLGVRGRADLVRVATERHWLD